MHDRETYSDKSLIKVFKKFKLKVTLTTDI